MTLTLREQYDLAMQPDFVLRVQQAMVSAAIDLSTSVPDYRLGSYVTQVLNNPEQMRQRLAFGVASRPEINANPTGAEIRVAVNSLMAAYAGAFNVTTPAPVAAPAAPMLAPSVVRRVRRQTVKKAKPPVKEDNTPWYKKLFGG